MSKSKLFLIFNLTVIVIIFIIGFKPSAFRAAISPPDLAYYNGQYLSFSGWVCEEADIDIKSRRLTLCANGQVLITTNLYPEYNYGDFLQVSGELKSPPLIDGFDYESYLARYDIYSVMYYPKLESAQGTLSWSQRLYLVLLRFKWSLKEIIEASLPEPEAGLANALLLGYRRTVDRSDLKIFSRVGLSHMIAISGSHITILSALIISFLLGLGWQRRRALIIVFIFLVLYPLMTGLSASAVRSAIMGGLAFLAIYYHRVSSLIRALVFSAALMLIFNPRLLRDDIGFQLSFLALLGIIYLYPLGEAAINRFLGKIKLRTRVRQILKAILDTVNLTLVSQIVSLPIILINFRQLSVIAPLANVLVLWTFPLLLASLIIAIFLTAIMPTLGTVWFLPAYLLLKYVFAISGWLASPSWAAVTVNGFNWWWGGGYYAILMILVYIFRRVTRP